ncbi:MAG: CsgG/HfaB family protein [Desulfobacterales bacterium]|jgi:TolB-like protein|nr:CsgG/HfaB family protein [Desulfobacterales bacterium]
MKKYIVTLLLFPILLVMLQAQAGAADFRKTKLAVLDFQLQGEGFETQDMGIIVAEWFITALVKAGRFEVIERGLLKKLLEEQKLSMTGIVDATTATKIGKFLGVKTIISGSVMKLQNVIEINARIIDVETASIIAAENVKSTAAVRLQDLVVQMSEKIIKNFPLEGYIVNKTNSKVTIDLGRMAGVKEGMEFLVYKEGKIIKHPKTGEILDVQRIETGKIKIASVRDKIAEGDVLQEESPGSMSYGQLVSSIVGTLQPVQKEPTVDAALEEALSSKGSSGKKTFTSGDVVNMLRSSSLRDKEAAAKIVAKQYTNDQTILDIVNEELLKGYTGTSNSKDYVETMAWLCNALGASGQAKYASTLEKVSQEAPNRKLQKYALKNLRHLK